MPFFRPPPFSASGPKVRGGAGWPGRGGPPGRGGAPGRPDAGGALLLKTGFGPRGLAGGRWIRGGMNGARCESGGVGRRGGGGAASAERADGSSVVVGAAASSYGSAGTGGRSLKSAFARSSRLWAGAVSSSSCTTTGRSSSSAAISASRSAWAWASATATSAAVRRRLAGRASTGTGAGSAAFTALRRPFLAAGSSALFRFSRSQRTRTADTWSFSSAERWLRTKMFMSLSKPSSCSGSMPNSAARS